MKTMIIPFERISGNHINISFRRLIDFHTGKFHSDYDDPDYPNSNRKNCHKLMGFFIPEFQRKEIWTVEQKQKFIESSFLGFDLGQLVVAEGKFGTEEYDGWLIDGQQRLTAIRDFSENKFSIFNGIFYSDIKSENVSYDNNIYDNNSRITPYYHWIECNFDVIRLRDVTVEQLIELYDRLNYGGTAHTEEERPCNMNF